MLAAGVAIASGRAFAGVSRVEIPVNRVLDKYAKCGPEQRRSFFTNVWDEAVRVFAKGGISLRVVEREGEVLKHPSGKPRFGGLERGVINLVLTDRVPLDWDAALRPKSTCSKPSAPG